MAEQMDLIDVRPKNEKAILAKAKEYKQFSAKRQEILAEEVAAKKELLKLIHDSGVKPLEDGKIRFTCDGFTITVTPRDELVRVKEAGDEE